MKKTSVEGMNDYLPAEAGLREKLIARISEVYSRAGFCKIITPAVESGENLAGSDGGDNLRLIYKILKRGDKLTKALESGQVTENQLSDLGLRYDLTLPLARYYACHKDKLPSPFKVIQIGSVYRAERPQKGRLREFTQCDIDILGSAGNDCEVELIAVTADALRAAGLSVQAPEFTVRINDRRLLRDTLLHLGIAENLHGGVCVILDKLDKIGANGAAAELFEKGFAAHIDEAERVVRTFAELDFTAFTQISPEAAASLLAICESCKKLGIAVTFDPTLVRGQGYYTGTIFEISSTGYGGTIAGGGRYDGLVSKFSGGKDDVPAVGFSIGFERIFTLLCGREEPVSKAAILYHTNIAEAILYRREIADKYDSVVIAEKKKKLSKQLSSLAAAGVKKAIILEDKKEIDIEPLKVFARTLKRHFDGILIYFNTRLTNAIAESINTTVKRIKRVACGMRDMKSFIHRIYLSTASKRGIIFQ
ncbi:hypothetical protein FACS1894120_3440 [Clostridia bacterium]|nr:hypothetical protein FACS1894120_3440 [Clostridia bacterium]